MQVFIVMLREPQEDDEMHCIIAYNPYVCTYMYTHACMYVHVCDGDDGDFDNNDDDDDKNEKEEEF